MTMGEFTLLDWIVVVIVVYSVVSSLIRGFVREVLGLVTVLAGLLIAAWFHGRLASALGGVLRTENQALFASFAVLFLGTLLAGFVLIRVIQKFFEFASLQWFDRLLGGAFGLVRGWLVAAVIFLALTSFGIQAEAVRNSALSPYFLPAVRLVATVTPFDLKARFLIGYAQVERWWRENFPRDADPQSGSEGEAAPEGPTADPGP
jgi:membrane protein required for colicin V production